jgi:hypothetical protein
MWSLFLCLSLANADIAITYFNSTSFSSPISTTTLADLSALTLQGYTSARVSGTLAPAEADLLLLWLIPQSTFSGWLLLWLDDHLLIDTAQRGLRAWQNYSHAAGAAPPALRLDWLNSAPSPCTLALAWGGNFTAPGVVPAAAFTTAVLPAEAEAEALRARAAAPPWGWGTYAPQTFWSHVHLPSALALELTLVHPSSGARLGAVQVFPNANPALVRVAAHSFQGSTFTESSVSAWRGTACTTTLSSTLGAGGAGLVLLATANGTGCADLALLVTFNYLWQRVGVAAAEGDQAVVATAPGFEAVRIYASAASVPVAKPTTAPFFALALGDGGAVAVSTGAPVAPADAAAAIAAARAAHAAQRARFPGDLADAYDAQQTIIAANTLYTPYEGLVTPVSRGWTRGGVGYVVFPWDTLFLAWMASLEPASKDVAYSNIIAVVQGRTQRGFTPNYHAGTHDITSHSEPQIGAQVALEVYLRFREVWLVEKLFDTLLGWAEWVWTQRVGAGSAPGPLMVLGCDLVSGDDERTHPNLFSAGLESGIDNAVAFMGLDPAVDFDIDNSTGSGRIRQYDVAASALFVAECEALVALAAVVNRSDVVPLLRARGAAVAAAMNASLWNAAEGVYESTFYNLSFHKRRMPTAFYPMLSAALPDDRVLAMLPLLTSPLGFCVNDTHFGAGNADSSVLVTFSSGSDSVLCLSDACIGEAVNAHYTYVRQEGLAQVLPAPGAAAPATVPLNQWRHPVTGSHALTANATPPAPGYALVRREGSCYSAAAATQGMVPITLWYSASRGAYQSCAGNPACLEDVAKNEFEFVGVQCYGFNGTTPEQLPCRFSVPSTSRSDESFFADNYWRGRVWGPQVALVWLGLRRHDALPQARAARLVLVKHALALELQNWRLSRQVMENINSVCGAGEDGVGWGSDPFYTWGALLGHVALLEAGY